VVKVRPHSSDDAAVKVQGKQPSLRHAILAVSRLLDFAHHKNWILVGVAVALATLGADFAGQQTLLLPGLLVLAVITCVSSFRHSIDGLAAGVLGAGLGLAAIAFGLMSVGFPLSHPLVLTLFLMTYPCTFGSWVLLVKVRDLAEISGLTMDGLLLATLAGTLLVTKLERAESTIRFDSYSDVCLQLLFPIFSLATLAGTSLIGSLVGWRLPRQVGFFVGAQACLALTDIVPMIASIPEVWGLPARFGAVAYWLLILGLRSPTRWAIQMQPKNRSRGELAIAWFVGSIMIVLLAVPNSGPSEHVSAAVVVFLVMARMSIAYSGMRDADDLRLEARTDELTGLPNRRAFNETLASSIERHKPFSVMVLDLDRFKEVNDSMGHDVGDQVLKLTTARLRRAVGNSSGETKLFRLGGDEFACVVSPPDAVAEVGKDMRRFVAAPVVIEGQRIDQAVSIGIATFPTDAPDATGLLRLADTAMYRAKTARTGQEHFVAEESNLPPLKIEAALRHALEKDSFELYYQPQISLSGEPSVHGVEGLFRLRVDGKLLPTPIVIAIAESTQMMPELSRAVINRAVRDQARLAKLGFNLLMSLNVSPSDLSSGALIPQLVAAAKRHKVAPEKLCVEVTEEALLHDAVSAARTVNTLRALGFSVSMDDFGVGYSSLTNLRMLTVNELKIDRSFVQGMNDDNRTEALVRSIVHLARRLDTRVLIEGTETSIDAQKARKFGVDLAQGYLFSKPIPFDELTRWLPRMNSRALLELIEPTSKRSIPTGSEPTMGETVRTR
jgi:diguanylate cyclase